MVSKLLVELKSVQSYFESEYTQVLDSLFCLELKVALTTQTVLGAFGEAEADKAERSQLPWVEKLTMQTGASTNQN